MVNGVFPDFCCSLKFGNKKKHFICTLNYIMICNIITWLPYTYRAHKFSDTQPATSLALLRTQLMTAPMIPGRASAAFMPNQPSSDARALSLDLIHSSRPFSSLGGGSPPDAVEPPPPPGNASTSTPIAIPIAMSMEAIVIPCSLNRIRIFSAMRCPYPIL